ncbi:hypothetical protein [Clostridium rectalis]|uniref:hypothetical protein n=1 Tax=Clostridium rectalis TaxID=2040295 RepID=UPI000F63D704|nr:hypothetical protein [Clostridium rectalis]
MANVNINVGKGSLLVYKGIDFDFTFELEPPVESEDDLTTKKYKLDFYEDLQNNEVYKTSLFKKDWIRVDKIQNEQDGYLSITGIPKAKLKYKVELLNIKGEVIKTIKECQSKYISIEQKLTEKVLVPINLITTSTNSYNIIITVSFENHQIQSFSKEVILYNQAPTIIGKVNGDKLFVQIGDEANDLVKYNVFLNNNKIFPKDSEYTGYEPPLNNIIKLKSKDIIIRERNKIEINAIDNWGEKNTFIYEFIGEHIGLLFTDEKGDYYSTDIGEILKRLNFGQIVAGHLSDIKKVMIENNTGVDIKNLKISITPEKKPEKLTVFYGFESYTLIESDEELTNNNIIKNKDKVELFLRIYPDVEFEYRRAKFEIKAEAHPVT